MSASPAASGSASGSISQPASSSASDAPPPKRHQTRVLPLRFEEPDDDSISVDSDGHHNRRFKCRKASGEPDNVLEMLLLCEGAACPRVCHVKCAGLSAVPAADWYCELCGVAPGDAAESSDGSGGSDDDQQAQQPAAVAATVASIDERLAHWFNPHHVSSRASQRRTHASKLDAAAAELLAPGGGSFVARSELLNSVAGLVQAGHPALVPGSLAVAPPAAAAQAGPSNAAAAAAAAVAQLRVASRALVQAGTMGRLALAGMGSSADDFLLLPQKNAQLLRVAEALVRTLAAMPAGADGHMTLGCSCKNEFCVPVDAADKALPGPPALVLRLRKCAVEAATAGAKYPTPGHAAAAVRRLLIAPAASKMALLDREQAGQLWEAHRAAVRANLPRLSTDADAVAAVLAIAGVRELVLVLVSGCAKG